MPGLEQEKNNEVMIRLILVGVFYSSPWLFSFRTGTGSHTPVLLWSLCNVDADL